MKVTLKRSIIAVVVLLLLVGGAGILYLRFDPARRLARHVTKARIAVNGAQYGTALTEYEAALALDPSSAIVLTEIGYVRLAMEQPDRAVRHFEESIAAEPEYIRAWTGLIRARLALGQNDAAITDAERMLKQRRDDETLVVYGNALASTGAYGNALMALEEAARLAPDKHEPVMQRAELLGQLRRNAEQREVLREYAFRESGTGRERACLVLAEAALSERRAEDALALTTRGIGIKATPELAIRRAEALLQLGRFADGRAAIDELVADGNPSPNLPAAAYKVRAGCLLELNDVQGALRDAQQAARALPDDADVALTLARIHYKDGRAMQAQEECNRALSLSPDHTAAQNYLMLMLLDRKHYEQAIAFGRTLLDRRRNEVALRMLVRAYLAAGRPDDALKDLKPSPTSPAAGRVITPLPGNDSELERLQKLN
ncbi:MAG TPA: tetratricopeptide repeat protein, partial [Planctomycetota bacterium]|nr:tetratricopeptide repeat protein [Planctomycetota bacterium]